jgi:hypothetical protein
VTVGAVGDDDMIEIVSGLNPGDEVVVSGQFMLDSESRLGEALTGDHMHTHGGGGQDDGTEQVPPEDHAIIHTCPMPEHYHIVQYGSGKCPECGMALVPVDQTDNTDFYTCPMTQCGIAQKEEGRCTECGMRLIKYQPEAGHDR